MAKPVDAVVRGAQAYTQQAGLAVPDADYAKSLITEPASQRLASAYGRLPEFDSGAVPAYRQMREETMRQFDHLTKPVSRGGMGLNVEVTPGDPYGSGGYQDIHHELAHDVTENNRVKVLSSATTGGHPFFTNDQNNAFRAVHDVFGHLGSGRGVDFDGEEAAYQKHSRMFSPLARQAMATETRGQNSAVRATGEFPEQKVGVLPEHMQSLQFSRIGGPAALAAAAKRAGAKSQEQGII